MKNTMLPHIHFFIGLILVNFLGLKDQLSLLVILGSIIPDLDWILSILKKNNHRTFISHYPLFWLFLSIVSAFLMLDIYWLFVAGFFHLLIDVIDWEVYLLRPFSDFKFSIFSLDPLGILEGKRLREQIILYYQQKKIICTELMVFGLTILSIFLS